MKKKKYKLNAWAIVCKDYEIPLCNGGGAFWGKDALVNMTFRTRKEAEILKKYSGVRMNIKIIKCVISYEI